MMHRTQIYIPDRDMERLRSISEESGKSVGEIVRRLIDEYLEKLDKKNSKQKKGESHAIQDSLRG